MSRISREGETRAHEKRTGYSMEYVSALSLPPGVAKDGMAYHWARVTTRGSNDFNLEDLLRDGWALVPADRAASYVNLDPLNRNPLANQYICRKDTMLVEKDARLVQEKDRYYDQLAKTQIQKLEGVSNDLPTFRGPIKPI